MDVISLARELGREIQKDERYLAFQAAKKNSDDDKELQSKIADFNLKRIAVSREGEKADRDEKRMEEMNEELRASYNSVMQHPSMMAYNSARDEMDQMLQRISSIVNISAEGGDPETADYHPQASCGGSCAGCAGCR
jgi:cell fate (sporulation/competence/biofilm development) regulator YlbF (YheA/YmcA/DUF963 family)